MSTCDCPAAVRDRRQVRTDVAGTKSVIITICNCDRRQCAICNSYGWQLGARRCPMGHPM